MASIIIGTTPVIKYRFNTISVDNLIAAIMTVKKNGAIILRKELPEAYVDDNALEWQLSQEETLAIGTGGARIMLNWLLADGTRGASMEREIQTAGNHIPEVIT